MGWFRRKRRSDASMSALAAPRAIDKADDSIARRRKSSKRRRTTTTTTPTSDKAKDYAGHASSADTLSSRELDSRPRRPRFFRWSSREDITALPGSRELNVSPHLRPATYDDADIPYHFHLSSASQQSMPTPRNPTGKLQRKSSKRSAADVALPKRKSTKRRKDDHVREEEIRAMSASAWKRPATYGSTIMRRDSKRERHGFGRRFQRPDSTVSLPFPDSIHSSMSGSSDPWSYYLSKLDVFVPRPIIRSSIHGQSGSAGHSRRDLNSGADSRAAESRERRKTTPTKELLKGGRTIDRLADDFDSCDLRAILERDRRRTEAKQQRDAEKIRKKLERRAEKQRQQDAGIAVEDTSKRKRKGRHREKPSGLGIESPQLTEAENPKRKKKGAGQHLGHESNTRQLPPLQTGDRENMFKDEAGVNHRLALPAGLPIQEQRRLAGLSDPALTEVHPAHRPRAASPLEPEIPLRTVRSASRRSTPPPSRQQHYVAESPEAIEALPPLPSPTKQDASNARSTNRRSSRGFMSLFKRGPSLRRENRGRTESPPEPSFSNTSRDSMSRQPPPSHLVSLAAATSSSLAQSTSHFQQPFHPGRAGSSSTTTTGSRNLSRDRAAGVPVRTMSKFREDLPELPISPPDSRMNSPFSEGSPANKRNLAKLNVEPSFPLPESNPNSASGSVNADERASGEGNIMSISLASVDSEGSWLTGRPSKRYHSAMKSERSSGNTQSSHAQYPSQTPSFEELGMAEDEYFRRLTPGPQERVGSKSYGLEKKPSSTAMAPTPKFSVNDEEEDLTENEDDMRRTSIQKTDDEGLKKGDVQLKPRIMQPGALVKSREGLLNDFRASEEDLHSKQEQTPAAATGRPTGLPSPPPTSTMSIPEKLLPPLPASIHSSEAIETPASELSPSTDDEYAGFGAASPGEPITLARAESIKMKEAQIPRLLHIPKRSASGASSFDIPRDGKPIGLGLRRSSETERQKSEEAEARRTPDSATFM